MADDLDQADQDFSTVVLVDRAGTGGGEILYNGRRIPIRPEFTVPTRIARWLFSGTVSQLRVWTTDDRYVCRLAIKEGPTELVNLLDPEAFDTSKIEIKQGPVEGWNTNTVHRPTPMRAMSVAPDPGSLTERQGPGRRVGVGGGA